MLPFDRTRRKLRFRKSEPECVAFRSNFLRKFRGAAAAPRNLRRKFQVPPTRYQNFFGISECFTKGNQGFLIVTEHVMLNIFGSATLQLELFGMRSIPVTGAVCGALDLQGKFSVTRYFSEYYDMFGSATELYWAKKHNRLCTGLQILRRQFKSVLGFL